MKKRLISIVVALSIITSLFTFNMYSSAESTNLSPNMAILENILHGDRQFVLDTLIGTNFKTDFSSNPHALVNYIGDENTMMDNVLSQYQNENDPNYNPAYKAAVDIMEKVYNGDDYIQHAADWVTTFAADLLSIFSNDAQVVMDDLTYSVSQLQYESILKEALAADYTSSNGTELSTTELELENLKRLSDAVSCLKAFQAFALSYGKANHYDEKDENFRNAYDYYTKYLTSYSDSIEKALGSFSKVMNLGDTEDIASFIALMGTVAQYDLHCAELEAFDSEIPQYAAEYFVSSEDLEKMKFDKSVISGVDNALSAYMFINSIALQRDSIGDTLIRMSNTANPSLKPILIKFANEVGKAGDAKLMGYESLMKVLRDENATVDFAKWGTKKLSEKSSVIKSFKKKALTDTALSKAISGATNVVNISSWCADKTMSFGDTCKKTYELKFLKTLIAQAICTYEDDLDAYLANKTDENARIVLDDLLMIQKLRLRGETIAYKMTEGQWGSPLGRLLANGTLKKDETLTKYLDEAYQSRVDAFIGASAMPFTTDSLTIKNGETLTINYDSSYGGLYATYNKADGTIRGIGELKYRIANGLKVETGGKIITLLDSADAYIPYITNNGGDIIVAKGMKISEFTQNSGNTNFASGDFAIDYFSATGGKITSSLGTSSIQCSTLNLSNAVVESIPITCNGTTNISGNVTLNSLKANKVLNQSSGTLTLNGDLITSGDVHFGGSVTQNGGFFKLMGDLTGSSGKVTLDNVQVCGKLPQTISRDIYANNFTVVAKRLTLNNKVYVSGDYQSNGNIVNSSNIIFAGNINDDVVYEDVLSMTSDLVIDGDIVTAKKGVVLNGNLTIKNGGKLITKSLSVTNGNVTLENNAELTANGKTTLSGSSSNSLIVNETSKINFNKLTIIKSIGTIQINGDLKFGGDASITSSTLNGNGNIYLWCDLIGSSLMIDKPNNFHIVGKTPQTISCSGANFNNLSISNDCRSGVTFSSSVNCYGEYNKNDSNVSGTVTQK